MNSSTSQQHAPRADAYWVWLIADVSLDRARDVLPAAGFPAVDIELVQNAIRSVDGSVSPERRYLLEIHPAMMRQFRRDLGDAADTVEEWLVGFPFCDEQSWPAPGYWASRFMDIFLMDPARSPQNVDPAVWSAMRSAFRMEPWTGAFNEALGADMRNVSSDTGRREVALSAIERARSEPLSEYDLSIYNRFGWNDHGSQKGLRSIEIGVRRSWVIALWRTFMPHVSHDGALAIEALAHERDLENWQAAKSDVSLDTFARDYRVSGETMLSDVFPEPKPPPSLQSLLVSSSIP